MSYTIKNKDGVAVGGDEVLDERVKRAADQYEGWVEDDNGKRVYPEES